ncbi:hypothetical protein EOI86_05350 [Hwanghaeella grinnelliae]|uniref:Uncharacterized protein n=1 Tax=Hwanghaeella grinnelliae TaxID=2500179 RepID=A0A437QW51_9PROT|nr:hypothetical protein [Hwanghaeella grinnelliae]RVU38699.1 hypothetical protein EOI86_05350 [Hwanghaeella grinnelliae]
MRFLATILALLLPILAGPVLAQDAGVTVWRGKPGHYGDANHGREMAAWIREAQGHLGVGAAAIPKDIHKRFRIAFPAGLFDWARFRVGGTDRFWRQAARRGYGNGLVLVLGDVILFRTEDAARNHTLWYAGLEQAQNFRRFGIEKALERSGAAQRTATPTRLLGRNRIHTYPYRFLYPRWKTPRGKPPDETAPKPITVPGKIIVKPVNPFLNE